MTSLPPLTGRSPVTGQPLVTDRPPVTSRPDVPTKRPAPADCTAPDPPLCERYIEYKRQYCTNEWVTKRCKYLCGLCGKYKVFYILSLKDFTVLMNGSQNIANTCVGYVVSMQFLEHTLVKLLSLCYDTSPQNSVPTHLF